MKEMQIIESCQIMNKGRTERGRELFFVSYEMEYFSLLDLCSHFHKNTTIFSSVSHINPSSEIP